MHSNAAKTSGRKLRRSESTSDVLVHAEPLELARMIRGARAVLGWSQSELANRVGLSQPSIHRIEQGTSDLRRSTVVALENLLMTAGITFETLSRGGFRIVFRD
jgi:ribosome-binding protein aMBF1 (putative translation factor)